MLHALHIVERKVVPGLGPVGRALGGILQAGQHAGSCLAIGLLQGTDSSEEGAQLVAWSGSVWAKGSEKEVQHRTNAVCQRRR